MVAAGAISPPGRRTFELVVDDLTTRPRSTGGRRRRGPPPCRQPRSRAQRARRPGWSIRLGDHVQNKHVRAHGRRCVPIEEPTPRTALAAVLPSRFLARQSRKDPSAPTPGTGAASGATLVVTQPARRQAAKRRRHEAPRSKECSRRLVFKIASTPWPGHASVRTPGRRSHRGCSQRACAGGACTRPSWKHVARILVGPRPPGRRPHGRRERGSKSLLG